MKQLFGNENITATFSRSGELLRLFYPMADFKQFINWMKISVKINNSFNNTYMQRYVDNTNVLQTEIFNTYFSLRVLQTDFVPISKNVLIRNYLIKNESTEKLNVKLLVDSSILTNINNDTAGLVQHNSLIQYNHDLQ